LVQKQVLDLPEVPVDGLAAFCDLDVNNLFVTEKLLGFGNKAGFRLYLRHIAARLVIDSAAGEWGSCLLFA
jgi:hypothetical protein